jgi:hypothetical protein
MSSLALFAAGLAVSVVVFAALGLLVLGAILDGRDERARKEAASASLRPVAQVVPIPKREGEAA